MAQGIKRAVDLAKEILLLGKNNLNQLGKLTVKELMKIKGIGEAKAIAIAAALEIGRRRQAGSHLQKPVIATSRDFAGYLQSLLQDHNRGGICRGIFKPIKPDQSC